MKKEEILEKYISETFQGFPIDLIDRDEVRRTVSFSVYMFFERLNELKKSIWKEITNIL